MIRTITRPLAVLGTASVALAVALGVAASPAHAFAAGPSDNGLFGAADPTYDGAYRQSLGLLAFAALGKPAPQASIDWLLSQQCADGGWQAYRADTTKACTPSNPTTFSGPDSNSTAIAVEALAAIGVAPLVDPNTFLLSLQNSDGGFGYYVGATSDPNSTALAVQAFLAKGEDPAGTALTRAGKTPLDYLSSQQVLACDPAAEFGGIKSPFSGGHADTFASLQSVPALARKAFPLDSVITLGPVPASGCPTAPSAPLSPDAAAKAGAGYLSGVMTADGPVNGFDGKASISNTAYAVLALSAAGVGDDAKRQNAADWLVSNGVPATAGSDTDNPGELALVVLANKSVGFDNSANSHQSHATPATLQAILARIAATARVIETLTATPTPTPTATPVALGTGTGTGTGVTPVAATPQLPLTGASGTGQLALAGFTLLALGGGLVATSRRIASRSQG